MTTTTVRAVVASMTPVVIGTETSLVNTTTSPPRKKLNAVAQKIADEIEKGLRVLIGREDVVELCALHVAEQYGRPSEHSGYYDTDHLAEMAHDATALTSRSTGVYFALNPVAPALLARRANREERVGTGETTSDRHVVRRRYLLVDADPIRPAGISATDEEKAHARKVIIDVDAFLSDAGWPAPIMCDSGNGYHLLYRIDLHADDGGLVKRCLMALAAQHSDDDVAIDTAVHNPARICKLYGTLSRKGDSIPDRPHRRSEILTIPESLDVVPIELLERLAAQTPIEEPKPDAKRNGHAQHTTSSSQSRLSPGDDYAQRGDVRGVLTRHGWTQSSSGENEHWSRPGKDSGTSATMKDRVLYVFSENAEPFKANESYGPFAVATLLDYGGDYSAAAKSLAAQGYGTGTPKSNGTAPHTKLTTSRPVTPLAVGTRVKCTDGGYSNIGDVVDDNGGPTICVHFVSQEDDHAEKDIDRAEVHPLAGTTAGEPFRLKLLTTAEFLDADFRQHFLIKKVLVEGQPTVCGGAKKVLKTSTMVDLAVSLATGTPFLSHPDFGVPDIVPVMLLSGESGGYTLRETAKRIALARGRMLSSAPIFWGFDLPQISNAEHLAVLAEEIKKYGVKVVIIDPAYLCLLAAGMSSSITSNVFAMGPLLKGISDIGRETGVTPILCHHTRKADRQSSPFGVPDLEDLSGSGFAEWARQWLLIGRREAYEAGSGEHRLWLNVGGSAGHSGTYAVDVSEGTITDDHSERTWSGIVTKAAVAVAQKEQARQESKQQKTEQHAERIRKVLSAASEPLAKTKIRDQSGICSTPFGLAFTLLLDSGEVVASDFKGANGKNYTGFTLQKPATG